ncbi:MAG: hypothetical protein HKP52_13345 [Desulfofustis sp.]|nr:hypothetical protein [Desulfofustis sp.]
MKPPPSQPLIQSRLERVWRWFYDDFLGIVREMRWSYVPPLMVYLAAGISGFTGIIESFYVKEELGLSAQFLAGLGFWVGLPWALKMPLGHLVDLFWRHKALFVYLGAVLMTASLLIMIGLTGHPVAMTEFLKAEQWYILASLLAPVGFVLQDVVADAMTVEAVPTHDREGREFAEQEIKRMHITMQTLGRISIIGGSALVAGVGGWLATSLSYEVMYQFALVIPVISILGVSLGSIFNRVRVRRLQRLGVEPSKTADAAEALAPNWYILGGSAAFVVLSLVMGLSKLEFKKEAIFLGSLGVIGYLMHIILRDLNREKRLEIVGIAVIVFVFRAMPGFGAGASWWQIDVLGFDEAFFGTLRQISSLLVIVGLFGLRGWMTRRPIPYLIVFLSVYSTVMMLPYIGMFYGLHEWTAEHLGFGARTIAIIDTMADSPLGQVAMVPMLAWIAREAPARQKATYFAVMAAFTNLALSASQLATAYVNRLFLIERGDYSQLGGLFLTVALVGLVLPVVTVLIVNALKAKSVNQAQA